jgi:hypothetical protein
MKHLLSERVAETLVALAARPAGLRLAQIAKLTGAPLSSVQRTVESLLDEGIAVTDRTSRPKYRIAPEAPGYALTALAEWKLTSDRAFAIRQQIAAMEGDEALPRLDLDARLRDELRDPATATRLGAMARRLVWWEPAALTLARPERLILAAMAIGLDEDIEQIRSLFGTEAMRQVLADSPPGVFSPRQWTYWHAVFGYRRIPPLPARSTI